MSCRPALLLGFDLSRKQVATIRDLLPSLRRGGKTRPASPLGGGWFIFTGLIYGKVFARSKIVTEMLFEVSGHRCVTEAMMLHRTLDVFCEVDDFCQAFLPQWQASLIGPGGPAPRGPQPGLSTSEIITLLLVLHSSGFKHLKSFYHGFAEPLLCGYFPGMPCYEHFVALQKSVFVPLVSSSLSHLGTRTGLYSSTPPPCRSAIIIASTGTRSLPVWPNAARPRWAGSSATSISTCRLGPGHRDRSRAGRRQRNRGRHSRGWRPLGAAPQGYLPGHWRRHRAARQAE